MIDLRLFVMALAVYGDIHFSSTDGACPSDPTRFGRITVMITMDYKHLLPVVQSRKYVEEDDGNGRNVNVSGCSFQLDRGYPKQASSYSTSIETHSSFAIFSPVLALSH